MPKLLRLHWTPADKPPHFHMPINSQHSNKADMAACISIDMPSFAACALLLLPAEQPALLVSPAPTVS